MTNPNSVRNLIIVTIVFISIIMIISYTVSNAKYRKENDGKNIPFSEFIRGTPKLPSLAIILYGLVFGIVFGFLDNFFIYIGIDALEDIMPGNHLIKAGLGNTYSDVVGAIAGTYLQSIIRETYGFNNDDVPIWVNTVGIALGCLLGIYIPGYVMKNFLNKYF